MDEDNKNEDKDGILKYLNHSVEDLKVARDSLEERISVLQRNHWLTKSQEKVNFNISSLLTKIMFFLLGILLVSVGIFLYYSFPGLSGINHDKLLDAIPIFIVILFVLGGGIGAIMSLLNDNTSGLRKELSYVELVLRKKLINYSNKKVIFDSNMYDKIVDQELTLDELEQAKKKGYKFFMTHLQSDEISKCSDEDKRARLLLFMTTIRPEVVSTESHVFGVSRLGFSKWGSGDLLKNLKGNTTNPKANKDALIGEVAIKNNFILVTNDNRFRKLVLKSGGTALSFEEFKKDISS